MKEPLIISLLRSLRPFFTISSFEIKNLSSPYPILG